MKLDPTYIQAAMKLDENYAQQIDTLLHCLKVRCVNSDLKKTPKPLIKYVCQLAIPKKLSEKIDANEEVLKHILSTAGKKALSYHRDIIKCKTQQLPLSKAGIKNLAEKNLKKNIAQQNKCLFGEKSHTQIIRFIDMTDCPPEVFFNTDLQKSDIIFYTRYYFKKNNQIQADSSKETIVIRLHEHLPTLPANILECKLMKTLYVKNIEKLCFVPKLKPALEKLKAVFFETNNYQFLKTMLNTNNMRNLAKHTELCILFSKHIEKNEQNITFMKTLQRTYPNIKFGFSKKR